MIHTTLSKTSNGGASPEEKEKNQMSITNKAMIFVFGFFAYVFQDSMDDPVVYAMKNIVDCLSYMFNFNGDIRMLQYTQLLLNFYSGMLEGQVAPSLIPTVFTPTNTWLRAFSVTGLRLISMPSTRSDSTRLLRSGIVIDTQLWAELICSEANVDTEINSSYPSSTVDY